MPPDARLEIVPEFVHGLDGINADQETVILTWFHEAERHSRLTALFRFEPTFAMLLYGLDGCKRNCWVVAKSDDDFCTIRFAIEADLSRILNQAQSGHAVVVLDVPIGLSNSVRDCDAIARRFLKPHRHNSVFRPPCRDAVSFGLDYRRALEINRQRSGVGISKQAYCIGDRIRFVDELMTPALQKYVREGHPEVTLAVLDGDQPQEHHKRRAQGIAGRLDVLRRAAVPPFDPRQERLRLGRSELEVDDIVDAAAMLATARRVANGLARSFPDSPEPDERGLQMAIWA